MADSTPAQMSGSQKWKYGHLHLIDSIPAGDAKVAAALSTYANHVDTNRQSRHWVRAVQWIENILFLIGRQYVDDILVSRLSRDSNNDQRRGTSRAP
jgi:low temperature requirement protein LtrA